MINFSYFSQPQVFIGNPVDANDKLRARVGVISMRMLAPRKFMQKRKKLEVFKDAADEAYQKNWRRLMTQIQDAGSAVEVLRNQCLEDLPLSKDLVLGTLVRFKQLKKWKLVSEV